MTLAIKLDNGALIADADWLRMDDVMRGAHGHGVKVMPGKPVVLEEQRCEYSDLFRSHCAHCLGHVPSWDEPDTKKLAR